MSYWGNLGNLDKSKCVAVSRWNRDKSVYVYNDLLVNEKLLVWYKRGLVSKKRFEYEYKMYLLTLDVDKVYSDLNGKIILCYEKSGSFCHRYFIRDWFKYFGYECEEI